MIPVGRHAIDQFRRRVAPLPPVAARAALQVAARSITREGGVVVYAARYDDIPFTLVIRDGFVVTCWGSHEKEAVP
ncbi:MAG TPA: hypothetical protein VN837_05445 [Chloroflexota bacterium]|nr:hypothetical protein [Chloroflexota bacterium]